MKGLLIYSNNCEDVEAVSSTALLRRSGLEIVTATFNDVKQVKCVYGTALEAEYFVKDINIDEYDFLVIPGGSYVVNTYKEDVDFKDLVINFNKKGKLIAAICAGPMFLGEVGLLEDKNYTIFPGCERDNFKGNLQQYYKVVLDKNIITGRSVGAVIEFAYEIVKYVKGFTEAEQFLEKIYF